MGKSQEAGGVGKSGPSYAPSHALSYAPFYARLHASPVRNHMWLLCDCYVIAV